MSSSNHDVLEIEDDETRLQRIQTALEKLNKPSDSPRTNSVTDTLGSSSTAELGTGDPEHLKQLLARVQAFLPELEASNALVATADPASVDIENVNEDEEVVEMSLGLGVFEEKTGREGSSESDSDSSSESDSDSDSDSESSSSEDESLRIQQRPIRPLPKRARGPPEIVVLSETTFPD